mmetsp:Transcript_7791/g.18646  ORF Transcript_7791/g.18646 Transcript_7791/m.18646 type:complete len:294 (+) Transcript_7791:1053-1934(+)
MPEVEGVAAGPNAERQRQEARWVDHVSTAEPHDPRGVLRREELLHERLDRGERPACEDDRPRLGEHLREVSCGVEEGKLQPGSSHSLLRGGADLRPLCDDPSVRVGVCQGGEEGEERLQSARASVRARRRLFALKPTFFRCGLGKGRHFICLLLRAYASSWNRFTLSSPQSKRNSFTPQTRAGSVPVENVSRKASRRLTADSSVSRLHKLPGPRRDLYRSWYLESCCSAAWRSRRARSAAWAEFTASRRLWASSTMITASFRQMPKDSRDSADSSAAYGMKSMSAEGCACRVA